MIDNQFVRAEKLIAKKIKSRLVYPKKIRIFALS
jgi:hypothetical protein